MRLFSKAMLLGATLLVATGVRAQLLDSITAQPAQVRVGEAVQVTVELAITGGANCGLEVFFGDGKSAETAVMARDDVPFKVSHVYASAGTYTVFVGGRNVRSRPPCGGRDQTTEVVVIEVERPLAALPMTQQPGTVPLPGQRAVLSPAPAMAPAPKPLAEPPPAVLAAPVTAMDGPCSEGWKLVAKSLNKKTGAYVCSNKPSSALPMAKPVCAGELSYFENVKKGQYGCKP